jgi:glycosyltransferase involved in cell wall biosynthesis
LEAWRQEGIVEFKGYETDVRPYLAAAHVFVLPSTGEGVPRSILEALATGRPIITADTAGCRDTVVAGRNGVLVPFGDTEAVANAMKTYLAGGCVLDAAAAESRKLAEERFDARSVSAGIRHAMALA